MTAEERWWYRSKMAGKEQEIDSTSCKRKQGEHDEQALNKKQ